jgi:hypothetical protein
MANMPSNVRGARVDVKGLVYVSMLGESAFMLNLSERGMAVQAMEVLQPGCSLPVVFAIPETECEVQGLARIVWSDRSGRAGLEFTTVCELDQFRLRQWVSKNTDPN